MKNPDRNRKVMLGLVIGASLLAAACRDDRAPTEPVRGAAHQFLSATPATLFAVNSPRTLDNDFEALGKTLPGFGGLYYVNGTLTVVLTDTSKASMIGGAIANFLARYDVRQLGRAFGDAAKMRVVRGDFAWTQLAEWNRQILKMGVIAGLTQTDIDEVRNRISIGVVDDAAAARVRAALARLKVPTTAVIVEHIPAMTLLSDSLIGVVRPPGGGVAIHGNGYCTLSYNAYYHDATGTYDGKRYFLTVSHCTNTFGVVEVLSSDNPRTPTALESKSSIHTSGIVTRVQRVRSVTSAATAMPRQLSTTTR